MNIRKQYLAAGLVVVVGLSVIAIYTIIKNRGPAKTCLAEIPDIKTALNCPTITDDSNLTALLQSLWKEVKTGCEDLEADSCCQEDGNVFDFSFVGDTLSFSYTNMIFCRGNPHPDVSGEASYVWNLKDSSELKLETEMEVEKLTEFFWQNIDPQSNENYPAGLENGGCLEESEVMEFTAEIRKGGLNGGTEGPFFRFAKDAQGPYLQMSFHPSVYAARACQLKMNLRIEQLQPFLKENNRLQELVFR